jgi:hypothetical protein
VNTIFRGTLIFRNNTDVLHVWRTRHEKTVRLLEEQTMNEHMPCQVMAVAVTTLAHRLHTCVCHTAGLFGVPVGVVSQLGV